MSSWPIIALAALPWVLLPVAIFWRMRDVKSLDEYSAVAPREPPTVSIIIPARNEARNIEACVRSILASAWPAFEVIAVDDSSSDGTGAIARRIADMDARVSVLVAPALPPGWFGKQWACHVGASSAAGTLLLFTDADTRHGTELLTRSVNAMTARHADLFSVAGTQLMETFWERLLQPHFFALIVARFGATERMSASTDPYGKLANGQFMLMRRDAYVAAGGHEAVRAHVAEDLRMAQEWTRLGYSVQVVPAFDHLSTRMYDGLREIAAGWGKNIYAAGRDTIRLGRLGKMILRVTYPAPLLWEIVPAGVALGALLGIVPAAAGVWGGIVYAVNVLYWVAMQHLMRAPRWLAVLHPLAALALFGIFARAAWQGDRVEWKGRAYRSA